MASQLFRCKSIDQLLADSENAEIRLKKSLGWLSLTSLGIGAVIGSGIFTIIGTAIAGQKFQASSILNAPLLEYLIHHSASFGRPGAGPAIALSFTLVAIACGFASVCYAELAAMIPIAGSAYTYTYATMGELIAWIIGWDLILEYAVSNMAVSVGFSQHVVNLLDWFGVHPNPRWISPAYLPSGLSGAAQNRRDSRVRWLRLAIYSTRQLASVRAQRLARNSDRRLHRVFHLHWFRLRIHGRGGMQSPAARFAHRHHRDADYLHDSLCFGRRGAYRFGSLGYSD